jgi:hypothetical protein
LKEEEELTCQLKVVISFEPGMMARREMFE